MALSGNGGLIIPRDLCLLRSPMLVLFYFRANRLKRAKFISVPCDGVGVPRCILVPLSILRGAFVNHGELKSMR